MTAARIAVLASRAAVLDAKNAQPLAFLVLPAAAPLNAEQAAKVIAGVSKPSLCRSAVLGDYLTISCQVISDTTALQKYVSQAKTTAQVLGEMIGAWSNESNPLIEVRSFDEALLIDLSTLKGWILEYDSDATMSLRESDAPASLRNARAVVEFSRASSLGPLETNRSSED
jgi:hypothetical protein